MHFFTVHTTNFLYVYIFGVFCCCDSVIGKSGNTRLVLVSKKYRWNTLFWPIFIVLYYFDLPTTFRNFLT